MSEYRERKPTSKYPGPRGFLLILDIAFAKCQRATIQTNTNWELEKTVMFCTRYFFVAKYSKQRQMS